MRNKYKHLDNGVTELYVSRGKEAIPVLVNTSQIPLLSKYPEWKAYKANWNVPFNISSAVTEGSPKRIFMSRLIKGIEKKSLTVRYKNGDWTDLTDDNLVVVPCGQWDQRNEMIQPRAVVEVPKVVVEVPTKEVQQSLSFNDLSIKKDLLSGKIEISFNGKSVLLNISEQEAAKLAVIFQ